MKEEFVKSHFWYCSSDEGTYTRTNRKYKEQIIIKE